MEFHCAVARDSATAHASLTPAERRALGQLHGRARRADWRAGRLAAKRAVARALGVPDLCRIEIHSDPSRPPRAFLRSSPTRELDSLALSLAHAGGRAVAAVTRRGRIGVDLEPAGAVSTDATKYFTSSDERSAAPDATVCWVLKEAAWKALALTPADPLSSLELVWRGARVVAVRHSAVEHFVRAFLFPTWPGYLGALLIVPEAT